MTKKNEYKGSRILLVEDEETLAVGLEYNLAEEGYEVTWVQNGRDAVEFFEKGRFDLIVLDIMLPFLNGFEAAKKIRQSSPRIPILMLTARTAAADRVRGLESGADDYLAKPFHLQELLLRIKGMLRRKMWYADAAAKKPVFTFGDNEINFSNLQCRAGNSHFQLTYLEAMVLKYLVDKRGEIVSRKELLENVWNMSAEMETRTVDNFIVRLRKYFEPQPEKPVFITSVRSAGYMFLDRET
jgi:two-component system alkaline phosphatase synthesis response regulator PhoP